MQEDDRNDNSAHLLVFNDRCSEHSVFFLLFFLPHKTFSAVIYNSVLILLIQVLNSRIPPQWGTKISPRLVHLASTPFYWQIIIDLREIGVTVHKKESAWRGNRRGVVSIFFQYCQWHYVSVGAGVAWWSDWPWAGCPGLKSWQGRDFSLFRNIKTGSGACWSSYLMFARISFPKGKEARSWGWLTPIAEVNAWNSAFTISYIFMARCLSTGTLLSLYLCYISVEVNGTSLNLYFQAQRKWII